MGSSDIGIIEVEYGPVQSTVFGES
jgi:hypothetical protein